MDPRDFHQNTLDATNGARGTCPGGVADTLPSRGGLAAEILEGEAAGSRLANETLKMMFMWLCVPNQ